MSKSSYYSQQCKCGANDRAAASITFTGSTLGTVPRQKSRAITIYICPACVETPKRKTRQHIISSVLRAVHGALEKE